MKTTIVIPNYNGKHFLETCLTALEKQTTKKFHTLIIDNGSSDGSADYIEQNFPQIEVVRCEKNHGFCGAVNMGIRLAKTPYVLLLNNDTEVEANFVKALEEAIESHKNAFSISSKMLNFSDREKMDDAGDGYCLIGWQFQRGVGRAQSYFQKEQKIFSACAGAAIYRKEVFEKIGFFDENHFAYLEDMDIGFRARIFGYENWFCPEARVYHIGSGTSGSKYNDFKVKLSARNSVYMNYKNMPFGMRVLNFVPLFLGYFIKWRFFVKRGFGKVYLEGLKEGFQTRKTLQKVPFSAKRSIIYVQLEWELLKNCFLYVYEFYRRRVEA